MNPMISLDIETLSTHKNAVVASIGACRVTPEGLVEHTESDFYIRLDLQSQIDAGRHVDADTLRFWMGQDRETQAATFVGPKAAPCEALNALRQWILAQDHDGVWTKGPAFDGAILESLAEQFNAEPAWHFRQHRDIRTLESVIQMAGSEELSFAFYEAQMEAAGANKEVHNALADAKAQGRLLAWFMKEIRT